MPRSVSKPLTYRLSAKAEQVAGGSLVNVVDCHPHEAVTWWSREALATPETGMHVAMIVEQMASGEVLCFVFGVLNGCVWFGYQPSEKSTAESLYRSYNPFGYRGWWEYGEIFFADDPDHQGSSASHSVEKFALRLSQGGELFTLNVQSKEQPAQES